MVSDNSFGVKPSFEKGDVHAFMRFGAGCWVLGSGCWALGAGCWVLGAGFSVPRLARPAIWGKIGSDETRIGLLKCQPLFDTRDGVFRFGLMKINTMSFFSTLLYS